VCLNAGEVRNKGIIAYDMRIDPIIPGRNILKNVGNPKLDGIAAAPDIPKSP